MSGNQRGGRRTRDTNPDLKPQKPQTIGNLLGDVLKQAGVSERVEQAQIIPEWPSLVGPQIALVTSPQSITADGTLFVGVTTNAWMNELSLLEPELLKSLNAKDGRAPVKRIRWLLRR
jgi:predicted nucleic acid-binding Zn ribbon protein